MDRAAANYYADMKAKGKAVPPPQMTAASAPGKAPAAKPMPAAAPAKKWSPGRRSTRHRATGAAAPVGVLAAS